MDIDLTALALPQFLGLLLLVAGIDTAFSVVLAIANGNFDGEYLLDFLRTHILAKVAPIFALALIGSGVPALGIPAIPPAWGFALISGGLYVANTVASIKGSLDDKAIAPA